MAMHGHERLAGALIALAITATLPAWTACGRQGASGLQPEDVTSADVRRWMDELSNWGRWGDDDQLGALNLITPGETGRGAPAGDGGRRRVHVAAAARHAHLRHPGGRAAPTTRSGSATS